MPALNKRHIFFAIRLSIFIIPIAVLCLNPVISQAAETQEYIDEQWTLNRINLCPESDRLGALPDNRIQHNHCNNIRAIEQYEPEVHLYSSRTLHITHRQ